MASIKGLQIKNMVGFKGHEGEPLTQGDLYIDGKKVGYYSDDYCGGYSKIAFDDPTTRKLVEEKCKAYFEEHPEKALFEVVGKENFLKYVMKIGKTRK